MEQRLEEQLHALSVDMQDALAQLGACYASPEPWYLPYVPRELAPYYIKVDAAAQRIVGLREKRTALQKQQAQLVSARAAAARHEAATPAQNNEAVATC